MSWSQPIASRQFSNPRRIRVSSVVVSTRFERIARGVGAGVGVRERELVGGEAAGVGLHPVGPLAARGRVHHVARGRVVVHPDPVAEPPAEQGGGGHAQGLAREVPERHLDAADGPQEHVRRAVGARSQAGQQHVDAERDPCRSARAAAPGFPPSRPPRGCRRPRRCRGGRRRSSPSPACTSAWTLEDHHLDVADPGLPLLGAASA